MFGKLRARFKKLLAANRSGSVSVFNPRTWLRIFDWKTGAFQQHSEFTATGNPQPLLHATVHACIRAISTDIAKLPLQLWKLVNGVWQIGEQRALSPLLRRPNQYQTWQEFLTYWLCCKLTRGNAYILMLRDGRAAVVRMHVLDPDRTVPLIDQAGNVWYQVSYDQLRGITGVETVYIPSTEILHDKCITTTHPLIGDSPLQVAALTASAARRILNTHDQIYANGSVPPGVLTVPEGTSTEDMEKIQEKWGEFRKSGKIAVLEGGLKYEQISASSVTMQAIELLGWSHKDVCIAFGVPPWRVGVTDTTAPTNPEASSVAYHSETLQQYMTAIESLLAVGLDLPSVTALEFDESQLTRMDSAARYAKYKNAAGVLAPNEMRALEGYGPVPGGETPYLQQQNYSLAALAKRDSKEDPFATTAAKPASQGTQHDPAQTDQNVTEPAQ